MALPSMTWTRTENGTHGILRAVIDFSAGRPRPGVVSAYQVRTSDTLRYDDFLRRFIRQHFLLSDRRDFRQAKLDLNTGNPIANPIVWANTGVQFEVGLKNPSFL